MFVIDVGYHKIAVHRSQEAGIPVVGVVDTNHSPGRHRLRHPGNDDSAKAVALYAARWPTPCSRARPTRPPTWCRPPPGGDEFVEVEDEAA